jgi:hypothetical protein
MSYSNTEPSSTPKPTGMSFFKRLLLITVSIISLVVVLPLIALACLCAPALLSYLFLDFLPTGDPLGSYDSPDKRYRINTYLCNGGATVDYAVRGAVTDNKKVVFPTKTIYWEYHCNSATVKWLDPNTVRINDQMLNVERDVYDWRRSGSSPHGH